MKEVTRVAIDTSKSVFTLHGVDALGRALLRRNLRRQEMVEFFTRPSLEIAMEACGGSHHWGRVLQALGHSVQLIPPQYVKPFVKRGKNDRNDAEAISEAAARPDMRTVAVKSAERQAQAMLLSVRELLVRQRTQMVNALRGDAAEFGLVARPGDAGVAQLLSEAAEDDALPGPAKTALILLGQETGRLETRLADIDAKLAAQHKATPESKMLAEIPGIGPISALSMVLRVEFTQFRSGRHFASWLGLTPREHSTGGKTRLGGISRAGDERLRQLLVLGATAVIRHAKPGKSSAWLLALLARRPRKLAAGVRQAMFDRVRALRDAGHSVATIMRKTGFNRLTVAKWALLAVFPPRRITTPKPSSPAYCQAYLARRWAEGFRVGRRLLPEIQRLGYTGSFSNLERLLSQWRAASHKPRRTTPTLGAGLPAATDPATGHTISPTIAAVLCMKPRSLLTPRQATKMQC